MHTNSLAAFSTLKEHLSNRERIVLAVYANHHPTPLSDKYIMLLLNEIDANRVRPRVTELIKKGQLVETGRIVCQHTHQKGRHCRLKVDTKPQMELAI